MKKKTKKSTEKSANIEYKTKISMLMFDLLV